MLPCSAKRRVGSDVEFGLFSDIVWVDPCVPKTIRCVAHLDRVAMGRTPLLAQR